jgi:hypothetical protein
MLFFEHT